MLKRERPPNSTGHEPHHAAARWPWLFRRGPVGSWILPASARRDSGEASDCRRPSHSSEPVSRAKAPIAPNRQKPWQDRAPAPTVASKFGIHQPRTSGRAESRLRSSASELPPLSPTQPAQMAWSPSASFLQRPPVPPSARPTPAAPFRPWSPVPVRREPGARLASPARWRPRFPRGVSFLEAVLPPWRHPAWRQPWFPRRDCQPKPPRGHWPPCPWLRPQPLRVVSIGRRRLGRRGSRRAPHRTNRFLRALMPPWLPESREASRPTGFHFPGLPALGNPPNPRRPHPSPGGALAKPRCREGAKCPPGPCDAPNEPPGSSWLEDPPERPPRLRSRRSGREPRAG